MDDLALESLAVKEIIDEIERKKREEVESRRPPERKIHPNKRFLGRTIASVLQHNRRQYAQEKRNSSRKLRELDRKRRRTRSRSRTEEQRKNHNRASKRMCSEEYYPMDAESFPNQMQLDLPTVFFLNNMNQLLNKVPKVSTNQKNRKTKKKKKRRSDIRTIDLTKKKKNAKLKKKKKKKRTKSRQKTIKSKKRRRRKDNGSSSSSSSSSYSRSSECSVIESESESSSSSDASQSPPLLIDLT